MTQPPAFFPSLARRPVRLAFVTASLAVSCVLVLWMYTGGGRTPQPEAVAVAPVRGERLDAPEASPVPPVPPADTIPAEPDDFKSRQPGPGGNILITLDELGDFPYSPPLTPGEAAAATTLAGDGPTTPRVPARFRELDGMNIATYGYMIPVGMEEGRVQEFLLVSNILACCFGVIPALNQWVYVTMTGGPVEYRVNVPVLVGGRFEVGEEWRDGMVVSLYRMRADSLKPLGSR